MVRTLTLTLFACLASGPRQGPVSSNRGLLAFRQALLDAASDARVLIVATHPDDPYRGMSLVLRRQYGMKVTVLVATRGEGGQNAVGPELGQELRRIRTAETEAAARRLDVELCFLELPDFGYCRTAAEALDRWRGLRPRERLERKLDELRPDLVLTPHLPGEPHGQKRAVFHLLSRVMKDRDVRFFHQVDPDVEIPSLDLDLDRPDPDIGATYREMAYQALLEHRTQGPHQSLEEEVRSPVCLRLASGGGHSPVSLYASLPSMWDDKDRLSQWLDEMHAGMDLERLRSELGRLPGSYDLSKGAGKCMSLLGILRGLEQRAREGGDLETRLLQRIRALERAVLAASVHQSLLGPAEWEEGNEHLELRWRVRNRGSWPMRLVLDGLSPESARFFRLVTPEGGSRADASARKSEGVTIRSRDLGELPIRLARSTLAGEPAAAMLELSAHLEIAATRVPLRIRRRIRFIKPLELKAEPESRFLVPAAGGELPFSLRFEKPRSRSIHGLLAMTGPQGFRFLPESD
ncbi:MAG: PIG-L family deacetylase, partial [Planctomycetota bacterium]